MKKTNSTATNATVNEMMNVTELYNVFTSALLENNRIAKVNYSDAKTAPYTGLNDFSVNVKKSFYNVYMSVDNANKCMSVNDKLVVLDNQCDTTKKQLRCKLVRFDKTDRDTLLKCIKVVCA
jgi:hypothetical protein